MSLPTIRAIKKNNCINYIAFYIGLNYFVLFIASDIPIIAYLHFDYVEKMAAVDILKKL